MDKVHSELVYKPKPLKDGDIFHRNHVLHDGKYYAEKVTLRLCGCETCYQTYKSDRAASTAGTFGTKML